MHVGICSYEWASKAVRQILNCIVTPVAFPPTYSSKEREHFEQAYGAYVVLGQNAVDLSLPPWLRVDAFDCVEGLQQPRYLPSTRNRIGWREL